jgi:pimeloyl-ACP methyl ester carboxylesterase
MPALTPSRIERYKRVPFLSINGACLEYEWIGRDQHVREPVVLLHEGLGSISMWKDFPTRLSQSLDRPVFVYSRLGYGRSDKLTAPRNVRYMHDEALQVLPAVLDQAGISRPLLFGHSDGASIALIHAGESNRPVAGVIAMAPHIFVEDLSVTSIEAAKAAYQQTNLRERLARHHDDVDGAFWGWNNIWLDPQFRQWNIEDSVMEIRCPILAIQGYDDEYGTLAQIERIAALATQVQLVKLAGCGHSAHRDNPEAVLCAIATWGKSA